MTHQHHGRHRIGDKTLVDPVCGMKVTADPAKSVSHEGTTYYFCSTRCMEKFSADPLRYAEKKKRPGAGAAPGAIYTCPMHPEIRQVGPGNCPKCGMADRKSTRLNSSHLVRSYAVFCLKKKKVK